MNEIVTYICINTHGALYPSSTDDYTPIKLANPTFMNVEKFTITFPGTTGFGGSEECEKAKELTESEEFITSKRMETELKKTYFENIPKRRRMDSIIKKSNLEEHIGDVSKSSIPYHEPMEPQQGAFFFKSYEIDQIYTRNLFSIDILNGRFAGSNILDYNFLSKYYPSILAADSSEFFTFPNGIRVLKEIELSELLYLLYSIGITNVFIIDPSCSNNIDAKNLREERRMKRAEIQARAQKNSRSGTIISMDEPSTNSICKKCPTTAVATAAAAAGIACCLGSMGASVPVTATGALDAAASVPIIQKIKREGGKKNKNKTKSKKYYKNKRTRKNKTKRSYKK